MFPSKLKAMSVGAIWLSRVKEVAQPIALANDDCPVCGKAWTHPGAQGSSVLVVLADLPDDEAQQTLLENCLAAAGWHISSSRIFFHAACSKQQQGALAAFEQHIVSESPKHVIVFGSVAAQWIHPVFDVNRYPDTKLIVTHHLKEMMRTPALKAQVWADMCRTMSGSFAFHDALHSGSAC